MQQGYKPYILFLFMMWLVMILDFIFDDNSTDAISLYVGLCFILSILFFNNKTYKHRDTKK